MANKYYQNYKERLQKEACERYQNFLKKKKGNGEKRSEKDIKIFLRNKIRNYLSI